jgi:hypothetical protein
MEMNPSSPKYFKASIFTTLAILVLPITMIIPFLSDSSSFNAGAMQGAFIGVLVTMLSIITTAIIFPTSAFYLNRLGKFSRSSFVLLNMSAVIFLAVVCSLAISQITRSRFDGRMMMLIWCLASVYILPFVILWIINSFPKTELIIAA